MTLVQRPVAPQIVGPTDQMYGSITANTDPSQTCRCTDPALHRLIELINSGMDQFQASKLWGDGGQPASPEVARPAAAALMPAPTVTPMSSPGARFPWLRRTTARRSWTG